MRKETQFGLLIVVVVLIGFTVIIVRQVKRIFPTETGALPVSVDTADNLEASDPTDFSTVTSTAASQSESIDEIPVGPTNNAISEEGWATREPLHNPPTEPLVLPEEEIDHNDMATAEATAASYGNQPDTMAIDTPVDPYAHTTEFPSAVDMNSPVSDSPVSSYYTDTASSEQLETSSDIIPSRDPLSFESDISHSSTEYESVTPAQATFSDPIDLEPQNQTTSSTQRLFPTEGNPSVYEETEPSQTNMQSIQTPRQTSVSGQGPLQWIIKPGDSFWKIAEKHYGSGVYHQALAKWNASVVSSEQFLKPGIVIETPHKKRLRNRFPKLVPSQAKRESSQKQPGNTSFGGINRQYVVRPGDTLFQIAKKTLGKGGLWNTIFKMNRDLLKHPDRLAPGMVLKVPHTSETPPSLNSTVVPRQASNKNRF